MNGYSIAILGATGVVGRQMMQVLEERNFPVRKLRLLASARSAGSEQLFRGEKVKVREVTPEAFAGCDIVLGAVSGSLSKVWLPHITASGAVYIDNSSAFRMKEDVPLVVPEINPEDAKKHHGVIANPNCSTIITMVAVAAVERAVGIEKMVACTYQAVSGAGKGGMQEYLDELQAYAEGKPYTPTVFPAPILSNVIPQIGDRLENGYTTEEMKMQNEGRKILHNPGLQVCCTCVRVPVLRSHSIAVQMLTKAPVSPEEVQKLIAAAPGCRLFDGNGRDYPTPLDTTDQDLVYVGRVRRDLLCGDRGIALWCCGDQIRKGAATNAVQIAEVLCL